MIFLRQWVSLIVSLAFFNASVLGAHLHLCLDGQSPPSTSHLFELPEREHATGVSEVHDDVDVKASQLARAGKVSKFHPSSTTIVGASWSMPPLSFDEVWCGPALQNPQPLPIPRGFLPPLRGPPV